MNAVRRNEPCPCGSGRRFKDCHGNLAAQADKAASLALLEQRSLQLHEQGRLDEAERGYRELLELAPGHAIATHYLGMIAWARGELGEAEQLLRDSLAAEARLPELHNNLGLLLRDTGRFDEALAAYDRALAVDPEWFQAHNNRALVLEDLHRLDDAERAYRAALSSAPRFAAAQQNLARLLLLQGRFAEGWERYRWRLLAQGTSQALPEPAMARLPADLGGRRFVLLSEQGVGDVLFFLRFAPELCRRGATIAFRGDARLFPVLAATGLFALGCAPEGDEAPGLEPLYVGDLPGLLGAVDPARFPPSLALTPDASLVMSMGARLAALGRSPVIALTWRSGVAPVGPARSQIKEIPIEMLGGALKGLPARWVSIQRHPRPGERERLSDSLGADVHDCSADNDDLGAMLALLSLADAYVGPSNANTYLRAALGMSQEVFAPNPPEWRWMAKGSTSPWFFGMPVYRPDATGGWEGAFAALRAALERVLRATA